MHSEQRINAMLNRMDSWDDGSWSLRNFKNTFPSRIVNPTNVVLNATITVVKDSVKLGFEVAGFAVKTVIVRPVAWIARSNVGNNMPGLYDIAVRIKQIVKYVLSAASAVTLGILSPSLNFKFQCKIGTALNFKAKAAEEKAAADKAAAEVKAAEVKAAEVKAAADKAAAEVKAAADKAAAEVKAAADKAAAEVKAAEVKAAADKAAADKAAEVKAAADKAAEVKAAEVKAAADAATTDTKVDAVGDAEVADVDDSKVEEEKKTSDAEELANDAEVADVDDSKVEEEKKTDAEEPVVQIDKNEEPVPEELTENHVVEPKRRAWFNPMNIWYGGRDIKST